MEKFETPFISLFLSGHFHSQAGTFPYLVIVVPDSRCFALRLIRLLNKQHSKS